jgi:hypothetical protein
MVETQRMLIFERQVREPKLVFYMQKILMMKRKQIWMLTAVAAFIIAIALDITSFGQEAISWENIRILKILLIVAILIAVGLFLGLFIFSKLNYKNRISLTIPLVVLLFAFAGISKTTVNYYGLDGDYNYFTAKRDIKNNKIQILKTGLTLPEPNVDWNKKQDAENKIAARFGYKFMSLGCTVTNGIDIYNDVMEDYLEKVNGKNWRTKEQQTLDSIMNQ